MKDLREEYKKELIYQEIKSNNSTIKGMGWFLVGLAAVWILTATGFFEVDKGLVSISFIVTLILFMPCFVLRVKGDLSKLWVKYVLLTLICIASSVIISFLSYHAVLLYVVPLLFSIQYRRRRVIWFVYGVNTVTMLISSLASFYYGICDLNILLESQHMRSWYMDIITESALNIPFNDNPIFIIIVFEVFPRTIILLIYSIMIQYTVVSRNEDAYRITQLTYLKETDIRTRAFNKNKYDEMIKEYYPKVENIAVVFWDINNLKEINDVYGHAVGDATIERLSSLLYDYSDDRCRVYRIGGDEFLYIVDNPKDNEVQEVIGIIEKKLDESNINSTVKISSAVGYAQGKGKDILDVVKTADKRMYDNKRLCKESRE